MVTTKLSPHLIAVRSHRLLHFYWGSISVSFWWRLFSELNFYVICVVVDVALLVLFKWSYDFLILFFAVSCFFKRGWDYVFPSEMKDLNGGFAFDNFEFSSLLTSVTFSIHFSVFLILCCRAFVASISWLFCEFCCLRQLHWCHIFHDILNYSYDEIFFLSMNIYRLVVSSHTIFSFLPPPPLLSAVSTAYYLSYSCSCVES